MRSVVVHLTLISLALLAACRPVVEPRRGCVIDDDCAAGESCDEGACIKGGNCTPDALGNDSIDTALPGAEGQALITGQMCPGANEFFAVNAAQNQPLHIYLEWEGAADLDAIIIQGSGAEIPFANNVDGRFELGSTVLRAAPPFVVELRADTLPAAGVPYELSFKTGAGCFNDNECAGTCLPPPFTPSSPTGEDIDQGGIFSPGACVAPRAAICPNPDALEGVNDTRIAAEVLAAGNKTSCHHDEDWYRVPIAEASSMTVNFRHTGPGTGDFLVEIFDELGNRMRSVGYRGTPANTDQTFFVVLADVGDYFARVTQLHDEDTTYTLDVELTAASCAVAGQCETPGVVEYGRTECTGGACVCPPAGCAP